MRTLMALSLLVLLIASDSHAAGTIAGVVRRVFDGDTVLLATPANSRLKVRLYGIDAPEISKPGEPGQPFGEIAKRTLMYKIMGRQVAAEIVEEDQYQRAVAIVRYNGRDINREMVAEGMAWAYRQYLHGPYASVYIGAEDLARSRHKGLWRDRNPKPPWEFRQGDRGGGKRQGRHR